MSSPRKRQRGETNNNDDDNDEQESGSFGTHRANVIQNLFPKFIDIPITIISTQSASSHDEDRLDFRQCYFFNTWALNYVKDKNVVSGIKQTLFPDFLSKLSGPNFSLSFTSASTHLKCLQQYKMIEKTVNNSAQFANEACSQPIILAKEKIRKQISGVTPHATKTMSWKEHNVMKNTCDLETYKIGDIITLHEEEYPEEWTTLVYRNSIPKGGKTDMNAEDLFKQFQIRTRKKNALCNWTLPINQELNHNTQSCLSHQSYRPENAIIGDWPNNQASNTVTVTKKTNDHHLKWLYIMPMNNGGKSTIGQGYLNYDLVRRVSFVIRLWNTHGLCPNLQKNEKIPNWEFTTEKDVSSEDLNDFCSLNWPNNPYIEKGFVNALH